jgi:hypothetical protein
MTKIKLSPDAEENISTALSNPAPAPTALDVQGDQYPDDPSRDVVIPVIGLINKVGGLSEKFENKAGQYALGDSCLGKEVLVIPVSAVKLWQEVCRDGVKLEYGKEPQPLFFPSESAAKKKGYINDFSSTAPNRIEPIAKIGFLVIAPKDDTSGDYVVKVGDLQTQPARSTFRRAGFRNVYQPIYNHAHRQCLAKQINIAGMSNSWVFSAGVPWSHIWTLSSTVDKNDKNSWFVPTISKGPALPVEAVKWISDNYVGISQ